MSAIGGAARQRLMLLAAWAVLLLPLVLLGLFVAQRHAQGEAGLAQLEPRQARLLGILEQQGEIKAAGQRLEALRSEYLYSAGQDATQTGNLAQQRMRDLVAAAGMQVHSSQVLPPKEDHGFDRIGLTLTAEGDLVALQSALAVLSAQRPVVVLSDLDIRVNGGLGNHAPTAAPRLMVQFSLGVLRERS